MSVRASPTKTCSSLSDQETDTPIPGPSGNAGDATEGESTYGQILHSSVVIGGSSALNVVIGIVRTKAMALMLGPAGFGLMGIFSTIVALAQNLAELGINGSGVRQIAESVGSGDLQRISRTVIVLRRTAVVLGVLGAALLVMGAEKIALLTFGNAEHAGAIALLSMAVLFFLLDEAQGALLQGMRRVGDVAKVRVFGSLLGTIISVPLVYFLRLEGVALSLVAIAAASVLTSWWYSRRVRIERPILTIAEVGAEVGGLLRLGLAFMASSLLMMGAAYVVRIILIRQVGLAEAGLYQAAWTLGGLYVGFVLQAMGVDFFPRLVGAAGSNAECNRLVNEQSQISLLLASAGVIATLTFAPLVATIFYSSAFRPAAETLRWICLGMSLRVITWPMGILIQARNERLLFFLTELGLAAVNVGLTWVCVKQFGLRGAGIAFAACYLFHAAMVYPIVRRLTGFAWNPTTRRIAATFLIAITVVFACFLALPPNWAMTVGTLAFVLVSAHTLRTLLGLLAQGPHPAVVAALSRFRKFIP